MTGRTRLSRARVAAAALEVVDESGFDALSLSLVAESLGVGSSALYSHVDGVDGLRRVVAIEATRHLTGSVRDAAIGQAGDEALRAVAVAYRNFVHRHPGRFTATVRIDADQLDGADEDLQGVFVLIHQASGATMVEARRAAHSVRCAIHGFLVLEQSSGPGSEHDDGFDHLVETMCRGLAR